VTSISSVLARNALDAIAVVFAEILATSVGIKRSREGGSGARVLPFADTGHAGLAADYGA
jgi:hypothetical protein